MALEEKVQRSGEQLLERIREQIEQEVRGLVSEMLTIAAKERATAAELAAVPVLSASEPTPVESHTDEVLGRLLDGVRRLDQASRLTDVLNTLAELAGNEAPRAAVLTVQADRVRGWRFVGFGPTLDEDEARQVNLAFGEAGIVGRAVVTGDACSVVSGPNGVPRDAEPAFTTLSLGVHALAVPVLVGGQVMVVVYGDDAERRPEAAWRESLEVLARHAGHCLEALTALRAAQLALQDVESFFPENAGPTLPFDEGGVERPKPEADDPSLRPFPRERVSRSAQAAGVLTNGSTQPKASS